MGLRSTLIINLCVWAYIGLQSCGVVGFGVHSSGGGFKALYRKGMGGRYSERRNVKNETGKSESTSAVGNAGSSYKRTKKPRVVGTAVHHKEGSRCRR